ncbi:fumarylacetoacetase [Cysteiniphilum halobium]|uniref:fumarylacetoacetase n=1 Tax=Cysteiniphilum halobium TaxID=2219059 RepID=UPI003F844E9C
MLIIKANNPKLKSFIEIDKDCHFPIQNLPFGMFSKISEDKTYQRIGVAIGQYIFDVKAAYSEGLLPDFDLDITQMKTLNDLFQYGREKVRELRQIISDLLNSETATLRDNKTLLAKVLIKQSDCTLYLPIDVKGFTDFYSSREHAENVGKMFRDKDNPLLPNWLHLPVAYDGRAGSVVVSGTQVMRPNGQIKPNPDEAPIFSPSKALDVEVEMGAIIGLPSQHGQQVTMDQAPEHVIGMVLVNDWSARDIQKWEYQPLGPFLSKNFATSISPWVVTLDALEPFRVESPKQEPSVLDYLKRQEDWAVDITLELSIKAARQLDYEVISITNYKYMYWDMMQQLAHHSINGCPMMTGDILASGTISGKTKDSLGCFLEITEGGKYPIVLKNGEKRVFLQDGDSACIQGFCQGVGYKIGFGDLIGEIVPFSSTLVNNNAQRKDGHESKQQVCF